MKKRDLLTSLGQHLALVLMAATLLGAVFSAWNVQAGKASTTIRVTSFSDSVNTDGACTLREAIIAANKDVASGSGPNECPAGSGADIIKLPVGIYTLTRTDNGKEDSSSTGDLDITGDVTITTVGGPVTINTVSGFKDRLFHVLRGNVTIEGVTLSGGNVTGDGGGIYNLGNLTLRQSTLTANQAGARGGGVYNAGILSLTNVTASSNASKTSGGGVFNGSGTLSLNNTTLANNSADSDANGSGDGGGLFNQATLTIEHSTLKGNSAGGRGGGIYNTGSLKLNLTNATVSGNTSKVDGGGLFNFGGNASLNNVTIAENTADSDANGSGEGGGVARSGGMLSLKNTLIGKNADNSARTRYPDCSGEVVSQGYNLIQDLAGCAVTGTSTGNLSGVDPRLGSLQDNGGATLTHALLAGSPAIDAGNPAAPGSGGDSCAAVDQRGVSRLQAAACDMGAFELEDPLQTGPVFSVIAVVGTNDDRDDGACTFSHCSLREAIRAANARPNGGTPDEIHFNLSGGPPVIQVGSALPVVTNPVSIDGTTQPGGSLVLDGSKAAGCVDGLVISAGNSTVHGLTIRNFSCNGILLTTHGTNRILSNTLTQNGGDGIRVVSGSGNDLAGNLISANGGLGIDLGGDGLTPNDTGDIDTGANDLQNTPVLFGADPYRESGKTVVEGRLNAAAQTPYTLELFSNQSCDPSGSGEAEALLGSASLVTDDKGNAYFQTSFSGLPAGRFVTATATGPGGSTSELSACMRVDARNDSWPKALSLNLPQDISPVIVEQYLDQQGQSRWYSFEIQPNSRVVITLTDLPANYDLTLYKDINKAYSDLSTGQDLVRLGAEFASDAFNADGFSSDAFSSDAFSPQAFSPQAFSPQAFSPQAFSPQAFSPQAFSPQAFSPEALIADAFAPQAFSPQAFSPQAFSPQAFSPQAFSPQAFSSAQTRSLIGVSAFDGTASEGLSVNTWENTGDFYVRVRGRNGAFDPGVKFHLEVTQVLGDCADVNKNLPPTSLSATDGNFHTIILTDYARLAGSLDDKNALRDKLAEFAARPEVAGVVVDVGTDARVSAANVEADRNNNYQCPFAKNQVAYAVKMIITAYRAKNPLDYVVIIGNDEVVPFFRHADQAMLANEKNYAPPVLDTTASQASLKLGYVLSQDRYGTELEISHKDESFPIPDLAVGRLVETAADATQMLAAYLSAPGGIMPTPTSALVTGYDFLADNAEEVQKDLVAGLGSGGTVESLITPPNLSPADPDPRVWTADDLRSKLFGSRHDIIYLAGHFSASGALAADFSTRIDSTELVETTLDLKNALIYSAGCHSGYNTVDQHGVPFVTLQPDWAQAANSKGITLIAGTGYQYGDTDFIEYSERLYLEFTRRLRVGSGPVPIGKALMAAKRDYLVNTPQLRGIHEKALLEATLFGLPMFSVDMPGQGYTPPTDDSIVDGTSTYASNPGASLGLSYSDITVTPTLTQIPVTLKNVESNGSITATYLKGKNGVITNPVEPVLPAEVYNVSVSGTVLRGVGFREGAYTDLPDILPLIGAATTEVRGVHSPFVTEFFYPVRLWLVNYIDALADGSTRLVVTPAHFKLNEASGDRGTLRQFDSLKFRLFYSANVDSFPDGSSPALSAAPTIVRIAGIPAGDSVNFQARVVGNPAAGIQEVWVTYTAVQGTLYRTWQSLNLTQNPADSTLWEGTLNLPEDVLPGDVRYVVQAVNGVGLVAFDTNQGAYHIPRFEEPPTEQTLLTLISPETTGRYGTQVEFTAELTSGGTPLANQFVTFSLGPQSRRVITGTDGRAHAQLSLLGLPGPHQLKVTYPGSSVYISSTFAAPFKIERQSTSVELDPLAATANLNQDTGIVATVFDASGRRLGEKTVFFVLTGANGAISKAVITDYAGRAPLGKVSLPRGAYTVTAYFGGKDIPLQTDGTVTLVSYLDDRYEPATAAGSLDIVNRVPQAIADAYGTVEDISLTVNAPGVLGNDVDTDGDGLAALLVSGPSQGTVTLNADGSFIYEPAANFNGNDSFTYQANDGFGSGNIAVVTISVTPANDTPQVVDDSFTVDEDNPLVVPAPGLLANDSDVDGDTLTAILVSEPINGTLSLIGDGSFTYAPNADYHGSDSFSYKVNDGTVDSNVANVTIHVNSVNDPPICSAAEPSVRDFWPPNNNFYQVVIVDGTVTDPEGDPITITITSIFQDEPVGPQADGHILGSIAEVRAERLGSGDGRVYHISFLAEDGNGGSCTGKVRSGIVTHDQSGNLDAVDGGPIYDSTKPG